MPQSVQRRRAITLAPHKVVVDTTGVAQARQQFEDTQCALLADLLDPALLNMLRPRLEQTAWSDFAHGSIGTEVVSADLHAGSMLHFAINAPVVIEAVRAICGCNEITWFDGRIFRMDPAAGHYDSWHDDFLEARLVGMSINLSFEPYEGGEFEIRRKKTNTPIGRIANSIPGDASLFRLSSDLEHRVAPLAGTSARTAFAGWFRSGEPDLLARLRR